MDASFRMEDDAITCLFRFVPFSSILLHSFFFFFFFFFPKVQTPAKMESCSGFWSLKLVSVDLALAVSEGPLAV